MADTMPSFIAKANEALNDLSASIADDDPLRPTLDAALDTYDVFEQAFQDRHIERMRALYGPDA